MKSALSSTVALLVLSLARTAAAQSPADEELPPGMTSDDEGAHDFLLETEPEAPSDPSRVLITLGGGSSIRIIKDRDLSQQRFAPAFIDLFGAFVLPGQNGSLRHGIGAGASMNLTGDGPSGSLGVDGGGQIVLTPYYLAYLRVGWDYVLGGKIGVPFSLSPGLSPGLELALSFTYYLTAGFGLYAEATGDAFLGIAGTIHPLVSLELGLAFDYEVLP